MSIDSGSVQIMILLTFMNVAFDAHVLMRMCMFDPRVEEGGRICRADARLSLAPATGQHTVISNKATDSLLFPGISKSTPFLWSFARIDKQKLFHFSLKQAKEYVWRQSSNKEEKKRHKSTEEGIYRYQILFSSANLVSRMRRNVRRMAKVDRRVFQK